MRQPIRTYRYWLGIDQPHSMVPWVNGQKGTVQYYALELPSTNVRGLFQANGTVTAKYEYGPFGEPQGDGHQPAAALRRARAGRHDGSVLRPHPLVRCRDGPFHQRGPHRAGGRDQQLRVRRERPGEPE